ncbi:MAG TPA: glutaminase A [Firmicutes bacterium]|jgi:glutaminase|nr:glutaminase A [Bacillota bacterium]
MSSGFDYAALLEEVLNECRSQAERGQLATYIPELRKGNPRHAGIALQTATGFFEAGDTRVEFTLQSISKVLSLLVAIEERGPEAVFAKVGAEPTGDPFNSIMKLEMAERKPPNPMINAGAIAVCSLIPGSSVEERFARIAGLLERILDRPVAIDEAVYRSEKETAHRNRALAHFLKDINCLEGDVEEVLDLYFRQCSILVNCADLARIGMFFAAKGISGAGTPLVSARAVRLVCTFMATCGMYDGSGEFAIQVGIPAKSGVSGGILGAVPGRCGVATFGPALDRKGNSVVGISMLKRVSEILDLSIF